jgi:hypothetical protein
VPTLPVGELDAAAAATVIVTSLGRAPAGMETASDPSGEATFPPAAPMTADAVPA